MTTEPTCSVLDDAMKCPISMPGQALLQWGFSGGFADHSIQLPENVVDQILAWRDNARNAEPHRESGGADGSRPKMDRRPQLGFWAPGNYNNKCAVCGDWFIGDKRAQHCADCEYGGNQERSGDSPEA